MHAVERRILTFSKPRMWSSKAYIELNMEVMGFNLFVQLFPGEAAQAKVQKSILSFQIFFLNCLIIAVFMIWPISIAFFTSIGLAFLT